MLPTAKRNTVSVIRHRIEEIVQIFRVEDVPRASATSRGCGPMRADASRLRAVLDDSRTFALAGGAVLTPSLELGVRHDGGDAETGTGM